MLDAAVREAARRFGDRPAFVDADTAGRLLTYAQLDERSDAVAAALAERGVAAGDVVAIALPTCLAWPVAYAGVVKLGAVAAGINTRLTPVERTAVVAAADPVLTLADEDEVDDLVAAGAGTAPRRLPADPERPVAICFTSGSTGTPRGAVFSGRQLAFITRTDVGESWGSGGTSLAGTSFAHLGPMTKLPGTLQRGGTVHLMRRWSAPAALALTARERINTLAGIPTQVALMLAEPEADRLDLSCVRAVVIGGGPATPSLVREARARFDAPVCVRYSCTEAGIGLGTEPGDPAEDAEVSVGRPRGAVELAVREGETDLPDGEVGEVLLRSPAVMDGYHRDPDATSAVLTSDGFVRTGDLGWVDEAGRLRLAGRAVQRYVRGGYNVYPIEVEAVLAEHPAVREVAMVAVPDDVWGEVGVAVVVPARGHAPPTLDDLRGFARERLASHKLPERLELRDALPLNANHKVDTRRLAADLRTHPPR